MNSFGPLRAASVTPTIQRTGRVFGKNIVLRDVDDTDAEFILSLRLDPAKSRHLSAVDADVEKQRAWIRQYQQSSGQAYFIICDKTSLPLGTVRIYDAVGDSFSWGSWVLKDGAPASAAIESALLVYRLAIEAWGFQSAHFKVHRTNLSVLAFHERFGAQRIAETPDEVHLRIGLREVEQALARYARYLPADLPSQ